MKKLGVVLQYEIMTYLKNKSYVISTVIIAVIAAAIMFVPRFFDISSITGVDKGTEENTENNADDKSDNTDEDKDIMLIYDESGALSDIRMLQAAFDDMKVEKEVSEAALKDKISREEAKKGFIVHSLTDYEYIVYNKSMTDSTSMQFEQVLTALNQMVYCSTNNLDYEEIMTAFNPQIIKLFASGNKEEFFTLIFRASRVSFILLFVLGLPVIVCCRPILNLWLTEVPEYSISFIQLMLIFSLIDALSGPLWTSAQASGNIRNYMLIMASLIFLNVPIAYLLLKLGYSPVYVITTKVIINFITHNVRILYLKGLIGFPVAEYYRKVMFPVMLAFGIAAPGPWILRNVNSGLGWHILIFAFALILAIVTSWFILLSHNERRTITDKLKTIRLKHR